MWKKSKLDFFFQKKNWKFGKKKFWISKYFVESWWGVKENSSYWTIPIHKPAALVYRLRVYLEYEENPKFKDRGRNKR